MPLPFRGQSCKSCRLGCLVFWDGERFGERRAFGCWGCVRVSVASGACVYSLQRIGLPHLMGPDSRPCMLSTSSLNHKPQKSVHACYKSPCMHAQCPRSGRPGSPDRGYTRAPHYTQHAKRASSVTPCVLTIQTRCFCAPPASMGLSPCNSQHSRLRKKMDEVNAP